MATGHRSNQNSGTIELKSDQNLGAADDINEYADGGPVDPKLPQADLMNTAEIAKVPIETVESGQIIAEDSTNEIKGAGADQPA